MAQVSYTPLSPGAPENVNTLNTILAAITAGVNSVDSTQLASSSVATAAIQSGAVTAGKIASGAVSYDKLTTFPHVRVYNSSAQSIADSTSTTLTFDTEKYDTEAMHSTSANTGRLTCVTAGLYLVGGFTQFASNGTGNRQLQIVHNATTTIGMASEPGFASLGNTLSCSAIYRLAATDYVTLVAYQTSGGSLNAGGAEGTCGFWMAWIGA